MNNFYSFIKKYKWPLLSGVIVGTSYIPLPPWGILFCYLPLWWWLINKAENRKEAFVAGWVTQFSLTLIGFHWIFYTANVYGQFPWYLSFLTLIAFCTLAHIYIAITSYCFFIFKEKCKTNLSQQLIFLVLAHSLAETFWPGIFPWNLGYTLLWAKLPMYHFADLIGFLGLSFFLFVFHFMFAKIYFSNKSVSSKAIQSTLVVLGFVLLNLVGYLHGEKWKITDKELNVLLVQGNIGNIEKFMAEKGRNFRTDILNKYISLSQKGLNENKNVDLLFWPESAIPEFLNTNYRLNKNQKRLSEFLSSIEKPVLTGAFSKDDSNPNPESSVYNALFLLDKEGKELAMPYHKTILLIFGEYLPLSETFPILLKLLPFIANFGRGPGPSILPLPMDATKGDFALIGAQICYEGIFPDFSAGLAKNGAEILANVTNDSWYGVPFEPYQNMVMTLARGIEVRRPVIRSTNTGISTSIDAYGNFANFSPMQTEWAGVNKIKYLNNPPKTIFTDWGKNFWMIILIAFILHILLSINYEKFRKS